jgi:hypothetical protein
MADWARYQWLSVCLVQRMADCAPPASWTATSRARYCTRSSSTHSETRPMRSASSPVRVSQVSR